jgi:hypothetical protein
MRTSTKVRNSMLGICGVLACFTMGACNTTKATVDTTVNFFSSTTPNELFSSDGMVVKEQKINLFAGVTYENLRQEAAAGGGQYVTALASLYEIPVNKHHDFGMVLQRKHSDLFATSLAEDRTAHLKMVSALNRELTAASLIP